MKRFLYRDNQHKLDPYKLGPVVVEVEAESITEADKVFETHYGTHPSKLPHIGVQSEDADIAKVKRILEKEASRDRGKLRAILDREVGANETITGRILISLERIQWKRKKDPNE